MLQLAPLFPLSKKNTKDFGFNSGMKIMRRFFIVETPFKESG
jgi:hypothetical protein